MTKLYDGRFVSIVKFSGRRKFALVRNDNPRVAVDTFNNFGEAKLVAQYLDGKGGVCNSSTLCAAYEYAGILWG